MVTVRKALVRLTRGVLLFFIRVARATLGSSIIKMNFRLLSQLVSANNILRILGASVGDRTHIYSDICIYNLSGGDCRNLRIGSNVYIGPRCLFDLTSKITIEDDASVSAQVSFITHLDVGNQPLKNTVPRREGPITVKRGSWIGVNTTVLDTVTIGEFAMVGAMSLVNKDIPPHSISFGIPCKPKRPSNPSTDGPHPKSNE